MPFSIVFLDSHAGFLLSNTRDQPVHLYDAYSGAIRATYRPYNSLDEMESPTVVHFSCDGKRIVCGGFRSDRVIHIFDLAVPGRDSTVLRLGKTRRSTDGQKGLVSALASTHDGRYFAVGTYAPGSIYIYDDRSGHFPNNTVLNGLCVVGHGKGRKRRFVDTEENNTTDDEPVVDHQWIQHAKTKWFQGRAQGGVTQLQFAPDQEYLLYSASRRSDAILLWDLRMLSDTNEGQPIRGIGSFRTLSDTNQRLEFDLSEDGNTLYAGGMDRCVRIYDTQSTKLLGTLDQMDDAVNGVSFTHLTSTNKSYLAVATGSRRFPEDKEEDEDTKSPDGAVIPGYLRLFEFTGKTGEELDDFGKTA